MNVIALIMLDTCIHIMFVGEQINYFKVEPEARKATSCCTNGRLITPPLRGSSSPLSRGGVINPFLKYSYPSGACGGLFEKVTFFTFNVFVKCSLYILTLHNISKLKWWKTCMEYSYGEVDKKKSGWNKHETIKEYVDELYKYNFEVSFVGIVWIYLAHHHVM